MTFLSNRTKNAARRAGLVLVETEITDQHVLAFEICKSEQSEEPSCEYVGLYRLNQDGSFSFVDCCFGEDQPAHIEDEKKLRELLPEFYNLF